MKKLTLSIIVVSLFFAILTCGCQEQGQSSTKKDRLVGSENLRLKKELQQCGEDIEKQIKLLEQCQQEKVKMLSDSDESVKFLMDLHSEAAKENESLKARVAELESK